MAFPKRSKYGNVRTMYNGRLFDSKREADWAAQLDMMKAARDPKQQVVEVVYQNRMAIIMNGKTVAHYVADFLVHFRDGHSEVQDAKGMKTAVYILKKKLIEAQYGLKIIEV